jgi:hypothetical protein
MTYSEQPTVRLANLFLAVSKHAVVTSDERTDALHKNRPGKRSLTSKGFVMTGLPARFSTSLSMGNARAKQSEAHGSDLGKKRKGAGAHTSRSNKRAKGKRKERRVAGSDEEVWKTTDPCSRPLPHAIPWPVVNKSTLLQWLVREWVGLWIQQQ